MPNAIREAELMVKPLSAVLGAEVCCGQLSELSESQAKRLRSAIDEHLVLVIRDQQLSDPELISFGRQFGELDIAPFGYSDNQHKREHEEVLVISNVKRDGIPIGTLGDGEVVWHSDNSYRETPLSYSLLYALECPQQAGETAFSNMYMAYETLPEEMKDKIQSLVIKHDMTYLSSGELRRGFKDVNDPVIAPGPHHPIVRTHPKTGHNALYLGRRPNAYVCGLSREESESLLNCLWEHASDDRFSWAHEWQPGDVVIWDNQCLMHHRNPFDPSARRIMHRLQFKGGRPYFDPSARARGKHPRAQG